MEISEGELKDIFILWRVEWVDEGPNIDKLYKGIKDNKWPEESVDYFIELLDKVRKRNEIAKKHNIRVFPKQF